MTREEAIHLLQEDKALYETDICHASDGSPDGDLLEALDMAIEALKTQDRPRGHWIDMADFEQCSECRGTHLKEVDTYYGKAIWIKTDFCPNCGADMRGEDE